MLNTFITPRILLPHPWLNCFEELLVTSVRNIRSPRDVLSKAYAICYQAETTRYLITVRISTEGNTYQQHTKNQEFHINQLSLFRNPGMSEYTNSKLHTYN
jgi:hypothetical protein